MVGEQRCAISVRIIGVLHKDAPKLKVFMTSVSWSDDSEVIVYRSFQEFKEFHRQLKKRFPLLNPLKRKDRVIPKFRGETVKSSLRQKGSSQSVRRMRFLEGYCSKLMRCDLTVTQSSEVTQFFMPKEQDLQPDLTKNCIMILLSDDGSGEGGGSVNHQPAGNITHPFVNQTYRCVATYETKDTKNRPFKVALNEKLEVLIKDPAGWWLVENEDKRLAWFPAPYLELNEEEEENDNECLLGGALYCAARSYSTKKDDEVSVNIGSVVEVLRKSDDGWWLIRYNGKTGYVPSMYLQPYNNPRAGLYSVQRKLHSSTLNLATNGSTHGSSINLSKREAQAGVSYPSSILEENMPGQDSPPKSSGELDFPLRLHKACSLDVLSETWTHMAVPPEDQRDISILDSRKSSMSNMSTESELSILSSSSSLRSGSSSSHKEQEHPSMSSDSMVASVAPRVPPRPKAQEILTRCTTMTRKAALASKARLLPQPEAIHSR
uniref:NADPH oxidase organizer 1b n=1 Tax=Myripristis murdjan TaxID=586833 RepID=A0A668AUU4_9TELE